MRMRIAAAIIAAFVGAGLALPGLCAREEGAASSAPTVQARLPKASEVVKPTAYVSIAPVPRGAMFEIAVVAEIMDGFHINSNKPLEEYLIPTALEPQLPAGLRIVATEFPKAKELKFEFSEKPLAVYDGTVQIRVKLRAAPDAPLGAVKLPLTLRYQACNDVACLPPVKLPLAADLEIAAAGAKPVPQNPKIFQPQMNTDKHR
jgi:thiol:disulfide interchange protein DsbD